MTVFLILIAVLMLSLLVFIHELGHFVVARLVGVHVITFSIGFGRKLARWQGKDTEYCVSSLPFGGYVKLAGQDPDENLVYGPKDFRMKKIWQRASIVLAGPVANYAFAVLVLWALFAVGMYETPSERDLTVGVVAPHSAASEADIQPGDRLLTMQGEPIRDWEDFYMQVGLNARKNLRLTFQRQDKEHETLLTPKEVKRRGVGTFGEAGLASAFKPVVGHVVDSSAAQDAGLAVGDTIREINGRKILSWHEVSATVSELDTRGSFVIKRGDSVIVASIKPRYDDQYKRYMIGIQNAPPERIFKRYGFLESGKMALTRSVQMVMEIRRNLRALWERRVSPKSMAGPLGIMHMTAVMARIGFQALVIFLALLSVNFAVINLLPLVITDGGVLLFLFVEKLRGKPLATNWQIKIQYVFISLFIALFAFLTFNDVQRLFLLFWR